MGAKRKSLLLPRIESLIVQPVASHFTVSAAVLSVIKQKDFNYDPTSDTDLLN
jgi:hypothetical protein